MLINRMTGESRRQANPLWCAVRGDGRGTSFPAAIGLFATLAMALGILASRAPAAPDYQWAGMKGILDFEVTAVYGTQGVAAAGNRPATRRDAVSWSDSSGALWLFGGLGYDGSGAEGYLNDLWKYDPAANQWTWVKGANTMNQSGTYGTQGVPAADNTPGARNRSVSWIDSSGVLWLFGGYGTDGAGAQGRLNDLWKYDRAANQWTWVKGANTVNQSGTYGTQGVPAAGNTPGARVGSVSWIDGSGALWLFGGQGYDCGNYVTYLGDLWRFRDVTAPLDPASSVRAWQQY